MMAFMKLLRHDTEYPAPFCTCVVFMEKYADVEYNAQQTLPSILRLFLGGVYPLVAPPHTSQPVMHNRKPRVSPSMEKRKGTLPS